MIPDKAPKQTYTANGSATEYPIDFGVPDPENIHVYLNNVEQTSGFAVSSASLGSGYVKFDTAPEEGTSILIERITPIAQNLALGAGSAFYPKQIEKAFDKVTAILQEVRGGTVNTGGTTYADEAFHARGADNAGQADFAISAGSASSAGSALIAGVASGLASAAYTGMIAEAVSSGASAAIAQLQASDTVLSANRATLASGLTLAAEEDLLGSVTHPLATTSSAGAVMVLPSVSSKVTGSNSAIVVPTVNGMIDYVSSHGGNGSGSGGEYNGPFKVTCSGGTVYIEGAEENTGIAGYVYGQGFTSAAFGNTSFTLSTGQAHYSLIYAFGRKPGVYEAPSVYFGQATNSTVLTPMLSSAGISSNTPDAFCALLAKVYSSGATVIVEQSQFGNLYAPGWSPVATSNGDSGGSSVVYSGGTADYASAAGTASALVSGYVVSSATNAATAGTATVASSLPEAVYSGITSSIISTAKADIQSGGTAYYASSAAAAGLASGLTSAAKADIIASAGGGGSGGSGGIIVYSGGTADYASAAGTASSAGFASSAGGLTSDALAFIIEPTVSGTVDTFVDGYKSDGSAFEDLFTQGVFGGVAMVKSIQPGGNGDGHSYADLNQFTVPTAAAVYSHCLYNGPFAVHIDEGNDVNISAGAVVIGESRYTVSASSATVSSGYRLWLVGSSGASSATFAYSAVSSGSSPSVSSGMFAHCICGRHGMGEADVQQYQYGDIITVPWGITASGAGGYTGPFAVGVTSAGITVAGGRMYLGGAEYAVGSTTLTSSNGTVYYYVYYSSGSYYSGCSVAASASALATAIRGSQGYFTALANVSGGVVTQCHYGDIRIDGRVV